MKRIIVLMLLLAVGVAASLMTGCKNTPSKPSAEVVKKCIDESFEQVMRESNEFYTSMAIQEMTKHAQKGKITNTPLSKENIVPKKDRDGVERQMWSTIIEGTGQAELKAQGYGRLLYTEKKVRYMLFIFENAKGNFVWEKGNIDVLEAFNLGG